MTDDQQPTQAQIDAEMRALARPADTREAPADAPRLDYPPYRSSLLRHPSNGLHPADPETIELTAPVFGHRDVDPGGVRT